MRYLVTVAFQNGPDATVEVYASNISDAKFRAACVAESRYLRPSSHVVEIRRG